MHELHCCAVPEYYYRCQNFTTDLKLSHCKPNYTVVNPWKYFSFSHIALSRSKITKCPQRFLGLSVVHNLVQHAKCIWSSYNSTFFSNCDEYTSDWGEGIDCRDHGDGLVWLLNPLKIFSESLFFGKLRWLREAATQERVMTAMEPPTRCSLSRKRNSNLDRTNA